MREIEGDIFTTEDNLCHCVSADMVMGKGIAVGFKKRWGVPSFLHDDTPVLNREFQIGDVGVISDGHRKILYLVTKDKCWEKPTYESLRICLEKVSDMELKSLSMPRIGCGLDRLDWTRVSPMIQETLKDIQVTIYHL